jgi:cardiolipin synthase
MSYLIYLHTAVVIAFSVRILLRDDLSPSARLAWFIVLVILPGFGSVIYFLFGEADLGKKGVSKARRMQEKLRTAGGRHLGDAEILPTLIHKDYQPLFRYAASMNGFQPVPGNTARLMADPDDTLNSIIADIDAATDHVHALYYIWLDDRTGTALAEALIRAARRGVTCRAMTDGLGSRALVGSPLWTAMADAGVKLAVAFPLHRPLHTLLTSRIDLRNHRKITVIDGRVTYCGSRNSADPAFRPKRKYGPWVDIMVRFEGPVVAQNQLLFASDWMQATGDEVESFPLIAEPRPDGFPAQVFADGPTERKGGTPQLFSLALATARESVTISTPYFVPDATLVEALCAAAHRGIRVTLIFPRRNDSWVVAAASRSYYRRLLEAGCALHEFTGGLLHAKTLTVDREITMIGSSNLDMRSFDLNYENNILLQDTELTARVHDRQRDYIAGSHQVDLFEVLQWPYYKRIWQNVIATIGPVL